MAKRKEVYLSLAEVADRLSTDGKPLSRRTLLRWLSSGKFKGAHKLGDNTSPWRIPESAVNSLVEKQSDQSN